MPTDRPSHGLIAVLLITRPKSGPKLVFHYPCDPTTGRPRPGPVENQDSDDDDSEDENNYDQVNRSQRDDARNNDHASPLSFGNVEPGAGSKVLGYAVDTLEKLLSPGRWSDRKKFEICLDGTTFVGHPVYANEDGIWSTTASAAGQKKPLQPTGHATVDDAEQDFSDIIIHAPDNPTTSKALPVFAHVPESLDSYTGPSLATSFASASTTSAVPIEQLAMFHVVLALSDNTQDNPRMIYEHVAKKLSKALHYCQKRKNYLSIESRKLVALKTKAERGGSSAESIVRAMVESSELAWSLKEVYEKIAAGGTADIRLSGTPMSLHIPPQPSDLESQPQTGPLTHLSEHSGLLLLEDKPLLLRELSHPEASPLANFIRDHTPTKSLQKLSVRLNIPSPEIMGMSKHLIKWRKARPMAPLHSRNTYVVAPSAPTDKVPDLVPLYAKKFAALPTLPQMLKVLSGRPIQYGLLIPSKDHRGPYMEILAFLLRHGLVVQLRSFGWLLRGPASGAPDAEEEINRRPVSGISLLSPQLRPVREVREDDAGSVQSIETVVAAIPSLRTDDRVAPDSEEDDMRCQTDQKRLILDPLGPSDEEEKALTHLISSVEEEELREYLPTLLRYLDGEHALEDIAVAEGLKRAKVEEWLDYLRKRGLLQTFRAL